MKKYLFDCREKTVRNGKSHYADYLVMSLPEELVWKKVQELFDQLQQCGQDKEGSCSIVLQGVLGPYEEDGGELVTDNSYRQLEFAPTAGYNAEVTVTMGRFQAWNRLTQLLGWLQMSGEDRFDAEGCSMPLFGSIKEI